MIDCHPSCGSCSWREIAYEEQLERKLGGINEALEENGIEVQCEEILPSPRTEHYRNRMDFVINYEGKVGLREKGKWWRVIDDHTCFIADEEIERLFGEVRKWVQDSGLSFYDRKKDVGLLRYAVIRATTTGESLVTVVTSAPCHPGLDPGSAGGGSEGKQRRASGIKEEIPDSNLSTSQAMSRSCFRDDNQVEGEKLVRSKLEELADKSKPTTLLWAINETKSDVSFGQRLEVIEGKGFIEEEINGFRYRINPQAFFQTNSHGAKLLMDTVSEFSEIENKNLALDLYCGSGFFSLPLAKAFDKVVGVELVSEAIAEARVNAAINGIENVEFTDMKTEEFDWGGLKPDLVLVDPPRAGMHPKALGELLVNKPRAVIYVSCKYQKFAEEMKQLGEVYEIKEMRAIDMFPHTPHVELVSLLVRR